MTPITDLDALADLYGTPSEAALIKVADRITPQYRRWIAQSRFCVLTTVGPEGTDGSPRGDDGPVVSELDPKTLLMPDWRGNARTDSLRNIVRDGRVSLMFMVPGSTNVVRINGSAILTADAQITARFEQGGIHPKSVIVISIGEVYVQCARALMRANLWDGPVQAGTLPTIGEILAEQKQGFESGKYDAEWPDRAKSSMW